jgi:signal transduction histidine kinase
VVVDDEHACRHAVLIGTSRRADKGGVSDVTPSGYRSWIVGEVMLVGLLASATALFAASGWLDPAYALSGARLTMDTAVAVVALIVSVLAAIRFQVEGRLLDLSLAAGFCSTSVGTLAFLLPAVAEGDPPAQLAWAAIAARMLGVALIALAPFLERRVVRRRRILAGVGAGVTLGLGALWLAVHALAASSGPRVEGPLEGVTVVLAATVLACLWLVALLGFALRYRRHGRDLDSWVALAATLAFFAELHLAMSPVVSIDYVHQADVLRLVAYAILLVGVWRAIAHAEFGRAVALERARVAREIHDGLAQYLFAIATQARLLESGAPLESVLPRLREASDAAQREARFAVLALSSAGGTARFDAALRRYVELLTADGELEVDVAVDPRVRLAPEEQIEVFRIVQEALGNVRRHARARHAVVAIRQQGGRRVVEVRDDGVGFAEGTREGQGLANMRRRTEAIEGTLHVRSAPGSGTTLELFLRAV